MENTEGQENAAENLGENHRESVTQNLRVAFQEKFLGDPLVLQGSDHPGMVLVTAPLTGNNFLTWSRSVKLGLKAKMKLGFIDGKLERPEEGSEKFEMWQRADSMVTSWILNSISKELVDAFIYVSNARELWEELEERFGESNGPMVYQLQRDIGSLSQGNLSVAVYFTKLKKLWDEMICLMPLPICSCGCTCGAAKSVAANSNMSRLVQFLMGLNETFDHVRNQILIMEPLPSVNRAYSMVLRVEKQREIHSLTSESIESTALLARRNDYRREYSSDNKREYGRGVSNNKENYRPNTWRYRDGYRRNDRFCDHCNIPGHNKDSCFKIHGYPE